MDTNSGLITEQELQDAPRIQEVEEVKVPIVPVPSHALPLAFNHPAFGAHKEAYSYVNGDGHLVGYMARFEDAEGNKHYYPLTYCRYGAREAWRAEGLPNPAPLYNLREVINRPNVPVLVVRGERNVEAAKNLFPQFVVTTSPSGDGQINKADWSALKNRTVIVLAHADEREKQFIASVAYAAYRGGAKTVSAIKAETLACITWTEVGMVKRSVAPQGWDVAMAVDDGWSSETLAAEIGDISLLDPLLKPLVWDAKRQVDFRLQNSRVEAFIDKDETSYWLDICGQMEIIAFSRTAESVGWGKRFKIVNADGQAVDVDLPAKELAGDGAALRETLLDNGLLVGTNKLQREKLLEYISLAKTSVRILDVDRVGWAGEIFVAPDRIIGNHPSGETVRYAGKMTSLVCATGGTMEAWQQGIAAKAIGNSRITLGLCVAFSAALLDILGAESGGVHIIGSSSTGKTTLLHVAGSVWGVALKAISESGG